MRKTTNKKTKKELLKEIENLKKSQEEKDKSEAIIAAIGDCIIIQDTDYKIIYQNQVQNDLHGDRTGEICYRTYGGRDRICEDCPVEKTFKDGKIHRFEKRVATEKGNVYFELTSSPLKDSTGKIIAGIKIIRDITGQKRAEETLRESEEKYRTLIENIQGCVFILQDARFQYINEPFARAAGYEAAEIIGKDFREFIAPEDLELVEEYYFRRLAGENIPKEYELRVLRKDGTKILANISISIINYQGKAASMGVLRDITQRKRVEEELRESERFLENIFASIQDGIGIIDKDMNIIKVNNTAQSWYPHAAPMIGKKCYEAFHNRKERCEICPARETLITGKSAHNVIPKHGSAGKEVGWLEIYSYPLKDTATGKMKGVIEYVRDITERKLVEEELRQSEKKYRLLIENIQDAVFIIQDAKLQFVNQVCARITGYSIEEIIGMDFNRFVAPEDLKMVQDRYYRRQKGEDIPSEYEFHLLRKAGEKILVNMKVGIVTYRGRVASMGILKDITEQKRAEKLIKESEEKYRNLVELTTDIIYISDKNGNQLFINDAGYKMLEAIPEEVIGQRWSKWIHPEDRERSFKQFTEMVDKGIDVFDFENRYLSKSGRIINVLHNIRVLRNDEREVIGTQGIARDITERKHAEEALRLSSLVVENSPTVLFRWKAKEGWPVEFVSNNVVQFGYSPGDFLSGSLPFTSIVHPGDRERVSNEVRTYSQRGDDRFQQEYRIIAKNGTVHWIDDRTVIERSRDGQITNYQGIIIDITERKRTEEAIKKYNRELEESNRMKELFTDIMHHDLLNPLNVAKGYVELFMEDETDFQKKSCLEKVNRNLAKGMELIDNATKFSKLESMKYIEFENLDLKMVVEEAVENLTPLAVKAGMNIENNIRSRMLARANKIIEDVFTNIISNAIKYASKGKRIVVEGTDEGNFWSIRIIDFGAGIKDIEKKSIFERFHREEKRGVKGSGLGLTIAGKIVELNKGRIWVEDNPHGGAVFVVEIPKS